MQSKLILSNNMMAIIILALVLNLLFIVVNSFIIYYLYNLEDKKCNCNRDWRHDYIKYVSMFMIFNNILNLFSIELNIIKYLKGIIFILSIINIYAFYTYISELNNQDKDNFQDNLKIINNQIKQIENLVNEFSDFARMPKPIFKKNDLIELLKENIKLLSETDKSINIKLVNKIGNVFFVCDKEQLSRVFFNLLKNSIESIQQKVEKKHIFDKEILVEITKDNSHIKIIIIDNGIGFGTFSNNIKNILNPYVTTKKNGTGLGLSIVNKIINDHNGIIKFFSIDDGAKIIIDFNLHDSRNSNS